MRPTAIVRVSKEADTHQVELAVNGLKDNGFGIVVASRDVDVEIRDDKERDILEKRKRKGR